MPPAIPYMLHGPSQPHAPKATILQEFEVIVNQNPVISSSRSRAHTGSPPVVHQRDPAGRRLRQAHHMTRRTRLWLSGSTGWREACDDHLCQDNHGPEHSRLSSKLGWPAGSGQRRPAYPDTGQLLHRGSSRAILYRPVSIRVDKARQRPAISKVMMCQFSGSTPLPGASLPADSGDHQAGTLSGQYPPGSRSAYDGGSLVGGCGHLPADAAGRCGSPMASKTRRTTGSSGNGREPNETASRHPGGLPPDHAAPRPTA